MSLQKIDDSEKAVQELTVRVAGLRYDEEEKTYFMIVRMPSGRRETEDHGVQS